VLYCHLTPCVDLYVCSDIFLLPEVSLQKDMVTREESTRALEPSANKGALRHFRFGPAPYEQM
jgi:hypothetical protein